MIPRLPRLAAKRGIREGTRFARVQRKHWWDEAHRGGLAGGLSSAKAPPASLSPRSPNRETRHLPSTIASARRVFLRYQGARRTRRPRVVVQAIGMPWARSKEGGDSISCASRAFEYVCSFLSTESYLYIYIDIRTYMWYIRLEDLCVTLDTEGG